jgi:CBS domain-containing protein
MAQQTVKLENLKGALEEISAAGGAARLQLHLLSMEAQQRKGELSTQIDRLEQKLDRGLQKALAGATDQARQLTKTVQEFLGHHPSTEGSRQPKIDTFMTATLHTCSLGDSLTRAAQIMWDCDCGAVPVVDADGKLCGMLTDRDLCMAAYTKGSPLFAIAVSDVMSKHPHVCTVGDTLAHAISLMASAQVRRLPVVDAGGRPVGIVSLADIVHSAAFLGQKDAEGLMFQLLDAVSKRRSHTSSTGEPLAAE